MLNFFSHRVGLPFRDTLRYIFNKKSNGAMNGVLVEVFILSPCRLSTPFSASVQGGLWWCGSCCGNFRPPYTRADSEIAACILTHMRRKKKEKKKEKSLGRTQKKRVGRL